MVSASKILTVSYGTFSCTLEGFDDPFSTMRSIAEYFRDLAADDRYFGAEPPTPDTEMLHRIAERELRRPVEARIEDNNVILRQSEEAAPVAAPALEGAGVEPAQEAVEETAISQATDAADANDAPAKRSKAERKAARQAKQAQKNRKRRQAAKAARRLAEKAAAAELAAAELAEKTRATEAEAAEQAAADQAQAAKVADQQPADKTVADLSDASIAAKLMRIRAVVENDDSGTEADENAIDPAQSADFYAGMRGEAPEEAGLLDENLRENLVETPAKSVEAEPEQETDAGLLSRIADAADIYEEDNEALAEEAKPESEIEEDDDFLGKNAFSSDEEEVTEAAQKPIAIARVVKVRKAQPAQQHAADPVKSAPETPGKTGPKSSLSDEDEAALLAELAAVERDSIRESDERETQTTPQARTAFDDSDIAGADAIDRILAETDAKLMSDEANQRRASIAHLRAAVQAKRAETGDEAGTAPADDVDEYREDLVQVVRPRRPVANGGKPARRMAPLVLVSEQRIDAKEPSPAAQAPVRPRRVQAHADGGAEEGQNKHVQEFTAFLADKNPSGAEELLEAAAAFRIFVVQQETFSRPQVMGLVLKADHGSQVSREEGLRAFGKLIRDGVIRKIQRGRYTISENTRFRPDQARASA